MIDRNGNPVTVGARVQFEVDGRKWPVVGTVRAVTERTYSRGLGRGSTKQWEARCDDGDPANDDLHTNGMHCSAWVESKHIEVIR